MLDDIEVEYITLPGWDTDISSCRKFEDLPENAQNYVAFLEKELKVPIRWIGVGPARNAVIDRLDEKVATLS